MTRFDNKIQTHGEAVEIWRDSGSVEDGYGDTTPIWAMAYEEYAWIQKRKQGGNIPGVPGILDRAPYVIFLKSTTDAQDLDMVKTAAGVQYRIEKLNEVPAHRGATSHHSADARLVEEG